MKNYILLALAYLASAILAPTCQKSPSSPDFSEATENPSNLLASARSCDGCNLTLFVEVADWTYVSYLRVTYKVPGSNTPGVVVFTSLAPSPVTVCAEAGYSVTLQVAGGPAAVFARADDAAFGNRVIYLVNTSTTGTLDCSSTLQDCVNYPIWISSGTDPCGIAQG